MRSELVVADDAWHEREVMTVCLPKNAAQIYVAIFVRPARRVSHELGIGHWGGPPKNLKVRLPALLFPKRGAAGGRGLVVQVSGCADGANSMGAGPR